MDAITAIMTRRSIRQFTPDPVSDEDVEKLLRAAMAAPSAGNQQTWHFVVIRDPATMQAVTEFHPHTAMLGHAPLCLAVLADLNVERHSGMWVQDNSAATQNILLAAHAIGLGAVWLGIHPVAKREEGVAKLLDLPDHVRCLGLIAVGHPAANPGPADRYDPARVHREKW